MAELQEHSDPLVAAIEQVLTRVIGLQARAGVAGYWRTNAALHHAVGSLAEATSHAIAKR